MSHATSIRLPQQLHDDIQALAAVNAINFSQALQLALSTGLSSLQSRIRTHEPEPSIKATKTGFVVSMGAKSWQVDVGRGKRPAPAPIEDADDEDVRPELYGESFRSPQLERLLQV